MGNLSGNPVFAWTSDDYKVSATMQDYFANFVKTGNPNGTGLPNWPEGKIAPDGRVMRMRLDVQSAAEPELHRDRYLFLEKFYAR
jgi:para-nitrobenzyl esterase